LPCSSFGWSLKCKVRKSLKSKQVCKQKKIEMQMRGRKNERKFEKITFSKKKVET
jgi:hypothetical protein